MKKCPASIKKLYGKYIKYDRVCIYIHVCSLEYFRYAGGAFHWRGAQVGVVKFVISNALKNSTTWNQTLYSAISTVYEQSMINYMCDEYE